MAGSVEEEEWQEALGYADVAFTDVSYPTAPLGDSIYDAIALAREDDPAAAKAKDEFIWRAYGLDDPETYRHYRNEIPLGHVLGGAAYGGKGCLYCGREMTYTQTEHERIGDSAWLYSYLKARCGGCGWWMVTCLEEALGLYGVAEDARHAYAVLKRFDPSALDTPLHLAREHLARNHRRLARFDPYRFEELLADCLRDYFGDAEIVKLGGRQDGGIDIKAVRTDGQTVLIQVKRHADFAKKEGVSVVRELHGVMLREGVPSGMVITTAQDFSAAARREVEQTRRRLKRYSMELMSLEGVVDLLQAPRRQPGEPWLELGVETEGRARWKASEDWIERSALPATSPYAD